MPEKHFNIIEYYQSGDRSMKKKAKDWLKLLNDAYDKNFNRIGVDKMYQVLKEAKNNVEGKYPTKRFIRDFLQRQEHYQLNKKSSEKTDTIRSVIVSQPNTILQVDYLYFFWSTDGIDDARNLGPYDENTKQYYIDKN